MSRRIGRLAARVANDPFFLNSALVTFALSEGLDDTALAAALGCHPGILPALALCRRPSPLTGRFRSDVRAIVERFEVDEEALTMLIRRADVIDALRETDAFTLLAAARDRNEPKEPCP